MHIRRVIILFFFTFLSLFKYSIASNRDFILYQLKDEAQLEGKLRVYEDTSQKLGFEEICKIEKTGKFMPAPGDMLQFGYSKSNFWITTYFTYEGYDNREFYFVVPHPLIEKLSFYLTDDKDSIIRYTITGSKYPFAHREEENRYFVFRFIPQPGKSYKFYCMAHDGYGTLKVPFRLMTKDNYESSYELESFLLSSFFGLLMLAFCVCMALFINFRDKIYVFYGIYIVSLLLLRFTHFGFSYKYLYPEIPEFSEISKAIFWLMVSIGFINFVPLLISPTDSSFSGVKKILRIQTWLYLSFIGLSFVLHPYDTITTIFIYFMNANFMVTLLSVLYMIVHSLKIKYTPALYFTIAFIPMLLLCINVMLNNFKLVPYTFANRYFIELGSTFEIILLFGALVNRYKTRMDERYVLEYRLMEAEFMLKQKRVGEPEEKYKNSKFTREDVQAKHKELLGFIEQKKPFLDQDINLARLSQLSGIAPHLISQVINQVENKNFFDFINSYRIEHAKTMLKDPKFDNHSVEGVGYECGFNTKATFYTTFKKFTGITPAEFKKNAQTA